MICAVAVIEEWDPHPHHPLQRKQYLSKNYAHYHHHQKQQIHHKTFVHKRTPPATLLQRRVTILCQEYYVQNTQS